MQAQRNFDMQQLQKMESIKKIEFARLQQLERLKREIVNDRAFQIKCDYCGGYFDKRKSVNCPNCGGIVDNIM